MRESTKNTITNHIPLFRPSVLVARFHWSPTLPRKDCVRRGENRRSLFSRGRSTYFANPPPTPCQRWRRERGVHPCKKRRVRAKGVRRAGYDVCRLCVLLVFFTPVFLNPCHLPTVTFKETTLYSTGERHMLWNGGEGGRRGRTRVCWSVSRPSFAPLSSPRPRCCHLVFLPCSCLCRDAWSLPTHFPFSS